MTRRSKAEGQRPRVETPSSKLTRPWRGLPASGGLTNVLDVPPGTHGQRFHSASEDLLKALLTFSLFRYRMGRTRSIRMGPADSATPKIVHNSAQTLGYGSTIEPTTVMTTSIRSREKTVIEASLAQARLQSNPMDDTSQSSNVAIKHAKRKTPAIVARNGRSSQLRGPCSAQDPTSNKTAGPATAMPTHAIANTPVGRVSFRPVNKLLRSSQSN